MKNLIKRLIGADKIEAELNSKFVELENIHTKLEDEKNQLEDEKLKLLETTDPKAAATAKGEAYIAVIDTQVNADNIRNGFFELDWNNEFIEQLIDAGYKGESNEQIVDQWFRTVVTQMLQEEGQTADRDMGYINIIPMDDGKSEVS